MSRAFVRESDGDPGALPERAVSTHPNFVTPRGLAAIEARVRELEGERQAARDSGDAAARAPRSVSGFITAALVSNTHNEWPASNSLDAMGPPMFPRPTNPSS